MESLVLSFKDIDLIKRDFKIYWGHMLKSNIDQTYDLMAKMNWMTENYDKQKNTRLVDFSELPNADKAQFFRRNTRAAKNFIISYMKAQQPNFYSKDVLPWDKESTSIPVNKSKQFDEFKKNIDDLRAQKKKANKEL